MADGQKVVINLATGLEDPMLRAPDADLVYLPPAILAALPRKP